jgi:hypothetical protein
MSDLDRFYVLATQLDQEEPNPIVLPITRTGRMYDHPHESGYYVCYPGCGKPFLDIASKRAHQAWCRQQSYRESERPVSMQRLLGG